MERFGFRRSKPLALYSTRAEEDTEWPVGPFFEGSQSPSTASLPTASNSSLDSTSHDTHSFEQIMANTILIHQGGVLLSESEHEGSAGRTTVFSAALPISTQRLAY